MSAGNYVILACHSGEESKDSILQVLKSRITNVCSEVCKFDVPQDMKFGSFDSLIKMMDDLSKYDSQVEGIVRRIERQMVDLDSKAEFQVIYRQKTMSVESYVRSFQWDDTKWPRNRPVGDNLAALTSLVSRIDDDVKVKAYSFGDVKSALQNIAKSKGAVSFTTADLVDVITPDVVQPGDFVEREHLTTVLCCVARGSDKDFLANYESWSSRVCPRSAKQFTAVKNGKMGPLEDKDGASLYRVVIFKDAVEEFKVAAKGAKVAAREFTYSAETYKESQAKAEALQAEFKKQELQLKRNCAHAFSDVLVAWMHVKAMRVFVESVLRYGVPPNFASFVVKPVSLKNMKKLRGVLLDVFSAKGLFGQTYLGAGADKGGADADGEEYYPYVSLDLAPLAN